MRHNPNGVILHGRRNIYSEFFFQNQTQLGVGEPPLHQLVIHCEGDHVGVDATQVTGKAAHAIAVDFAGEELALLIILPQPLLPILQRHLHRPGKYPSLPHAAPKHLAHVAGVPDVFFGSDKHASYWAT